MAQFQLMKQAKVKSFIELISKIHQINNHEHQNPKDNHQQPHKLRKHHRQKHKCSITVNFAESESKAKDTTSKNESVSDQKNQVGIYFMEQSVKHRYDDKKTLYEIYRDSLREKKRSLNGFAGSFSKRDTFRRAEDDLQRAHQIAFSMNRSNRLKSLKEASTYQKIKRKRSIPSNNSIFILRQESERLDISNKTSQSQPTSQQPIQEPTVLQMRVRKLNYKPIFRIKRLTLDNCKTQIQAQLVNEVNQQLENQPLSKKFINLKTEIREADSKISSFREKIKFKSKQSKHLPKQIQKFTAWEYDKCEQNEELSRMLL